jgi:tetratricopeptide (TPR) repeat protein
VTRAWLGFAFALPALAASCAGPPWFMGSPLDGHPTIPRTTTDLSYREQRRASATARTRGETVLELRALLALDDVERLLPEQRERLVWLLERRATEFHALGRAVPESRDLARLARLAPARGAGLLGERADAERSAGDAWLAVGAVDEARGAYERAIQLGAPDMDFRLFALWRRPPPATVPLAELRAEIAALPLRAVPPFAMTYVARGGADRATLARGLAAARQERSEGLAARLEAALRAVPAVGDGGDGGDGADGAAAVAVPSPGDAGAVDAADIGPDGAGRDAPAADAPALALLPAELDAWVLRGLTVSARLLPLVRTRPDVLDDVPRAVAWVDLLLAEDETSPEILELAASVFGRAARFGGTERMLMELAYATPDRAEGLARGAAVWERLGKEREACVQWIRAARWRDEPEDPTWRRAISCARRDPGVGDWREIRGYVLGRARPERRAALAASLDAS